MIVNSNAMRPDTYAWATNRLARALLNNNTSSSTKYSALHRYITLFETGPVSKLGYS